MTAYHLVKHGKFRLCMYAVVWFLEKWLKTVVGKVTNVKIFQETVGQYLLGSYVRSAS